MRIRLAFALAVLLVGDAYGQDGFNSYPSGVSQAYVDAQIATLQGQIPQPADAVPPTDTLMGAIGSAPKFMRQDAARPTVSQRTTVTTDGSGNWTVTWAKSFVSSTPVVIPQPLTNTIGKPNCKVSTRTATGATGSCWYENVQVSTVSVVGIPVLSGITAVSSNYATGSVMVLGIEPSQ